LEAILLLVVHIIYQMVTLCNREDENDEDEDENDEDEEEIDSQSNLIINLGKI
jgi:hypothetical protein